MRKERASLSVPCCLFDDRQRWSVALHHVFFIKPPGRLPSSSLLLKCANAFPEKPSKPVCDTTCDEFFGRPVCTPTPILRSKLVKKEGENGKGDGGLRKYRIESVEKQWFEARERNARDKYPQCLCFRLFSSVASSRLYYSIYCTYFLSVRIRADFN